MVDKGPLSDLNQGHHTSRLVSWPQQLLLEPFLLRISVNKLFLGSTPNKTGINQLACLMCKSTRHAVEIWEVCTQAPLRPTITHNSL